MKICYLIMLLLVVSFTALAQPSAPPATPIDGGLGFLLAGGLFLGIKKLLNKK